MEVQNYKDIAGFEKGNWWYQSRRKIIASILDRFSKNKVDTILDLGCGVGSNAPILAPRAQKLVGLDISPHALSFARTASYGSLIEANAEEIPLPDESVDVVVCTDVLEHLDDQKAILEIKRVLKNKGLLVLTVPAFPSLWNANDDYSHHLRRYRLDEIEALIRRVGLSVRYISFWNIAFFFPVWIVARLYRSRKAGIELKNNLSLIPSWLNGILIIYMKFETAISIRFPIRFGVSIILAGEKE